MSGLAVEETLELWASSLRDVKSRTRVLFTQERVAASSGQFLDGLLGYAQGISNVFLRKTVLPPQPDQI